ncbi:MAG: hypothetical protein ABI651_18690 [Verrucomicrobiota bacterium]
MNSTYRPSLNAFLTQENDRVRGIDHRHHMWQSSERVPRRASEDYLRALSDALQLDPAALKNLHQQVDYLNPREQGLEYRLTEEKSFFDSTTVGYWQTYHNVPIWKAGLSVTVKHNPNRIVASVNTSQDVGNPALPSAKKIETYKRLFKRGKTEVALVEASDDAASISKETSRYLAERFDLHRLKPSKAGKKAAADAESPAPVWKMGRFFLYQYDPGQRIDQHIEHSEEPSKNSNGFAEVHHTLPLPPVNKRIKEGRYYLVAEIVFTFAPPGLPPMNWVALIDVETDSVLYLRCLTDNISGMVFDLDPITNTGSVANAPSASAATLDPVRSSVVLPGLTAPPPMTNQSLTGEFINISDFELAAASPPTEPAGSNFDFGSRTNNFIAVNAYYHCDKFFRFVEELGFPRAIYFDGTTFPVPVDHRGRYGSLDGIERNASCSGNGTGGIANVDFELADLGDTTNPIGIAADWRVVLHELGGHGILYDHVNTANFGFAHSAGDSFGAILNDPYSNAADRFETFPWVSFISRRHDRGVAAGWAFGGVNDLHGYDSEQILSTTLFRIYRSIGGDSVDHARRVFASRVAAYLILRGVGTLTPATNPGNALGLCNAMMAVDLLNWTSEGLDGGAYNKVIRWAFEKQGLFQPAGAPTPVVSAGVPPAVDLYIDDGRTGEYQYQAVHWQNGSIWNRNAADGLPGHQEPILGQPNYAYVQIKNRGASTATAITVRGFHSLPGAGLTWPGDFTELSPAGGLTVPSLAGNSTVTTTVGPFTWTPNINAYGHDCMLMIVSNAADPSNIDQFTAGESIAEWRLVPNDNNVGQRNMYPVPGGGGATPLFEALHEKFLYAGNTFRVPMPCEPLVRLPAFLARNGWAITFKDHDAAAFELKPGEKRKLVMQVKQGRTFSKEDVLASAERDIVVEIRVGGMLMGGMTYAIDPERTRAVNGQADSSTDKCGAKAQDLLRCLALNAGQVSKVCVKKVSLDIEIKGDCGCDD